MPGSGSARRDTAAKARRATGGRIALAIAAVVVLGATIGLAGYARSVARDDGGAGHAGGAGARVGAGGDGVHDRAADRDAASARTTQPPASRAAGDGSRPAASAAEAPETPETSTTPETPVAEDRFLTPGASSRASPAPSSLPPSLPPSTVPAPAPPDPPRAPLAPPAPAVDDPRDFELPPANDGETR